MKRGQSAHPSVCCAPVKGKPTLRVAYFFSGIARKASIGQHLRQICIEDGFSLDFAEIDILLSGEDHDLMNKASQDAWIQKVEGGEIHVSLPSPPCGSWSRANWANTNGPAPCRNRRHPWGIPHQRRAQQRRAETGNEFVHISIRAIKASATAKSRGFFARSLLENPERRTCKHLAGG